MDENRKAMQFILILFLTGMFLMITGQWIIHNNLTDHIPVMSFLKFKSEWFIRLLYAIMVILTAYLTPGKRNQWVAENINYMFVLMFILAAGFLIGFSGIKYYDLFFFPIVFAAYTIVAFIVISNITDHRVKADKSIFGVSNEKNIERPDFYFTFETDQGTLKVHKPQQNIYIDGGPGSGKSASWIKGIITQCAERNYAGFIYDWEGDPTKKGSPILTKIAYGSIEHYKKAGKKTPQFAFVNFTDMFRTHRVNVLSEKYITPEIASLFIDNLVTTLLKNLEPTWKEKMDFWANNAVIYVKSIALKCYKERHLGINTLPHLITICLHNYDEVLAWLEEDKEIRMNIQSILTPWRAGGNSAGQLSGVISSVQTPMTKMNNKYLFWVMSPSKEEELDLDITNKNHPTLLCVGNAPTLKEAITPAVSCIASVLLSQMNNPDKQNSVFLVDEFPTVLLQGIDVFVGTARKHFVSTILALQDYNQAKRDYGENSAKILKANCSTQAFGMTGNDETANAVEKLFGEQKELNESFSEQDTGGNSRSETLQKDKVLKSRDIAGQSAGHFVGKIADGKPPFFNLQFKQCVYYSEEIPPFSKKVNTGDEIRDKEIMETIIDKNYEKIIDDIEKLLSPYKI